jgi:transcription-repair coupling factor (superfamily II helicase)
MLYKTLLSNLLTSRKLKQLEQHVKDSDSVHVYGITSSAKPLLLAHLFESTGRNVLFVTLSGPSAQETAEDLDILIGKDSVYLLPDYELLPYEEFSPHPDCTVQRSRTLGAAISSKKGIYLLSLQEALRSINHPDNMRKHVLTLHTGEEYELDQLVEELVACGYTHTSMVTIPGELSKRGGILDVFTPQYENPYRIEFFGDEIVSIRPFYPSTQHSLSDKQEKDIQIYPYREFSLKDLANPIDSFFAEKISTQGFYEGIEQDMPKILSKTASFTHYFSAEDTYVVFDEFQDFSLKEQSLFDEVQKYYDERCDRADISYLSKPNELFMSYKQAKLDRFPSVYLTISYYDFSVPSIHIPIISQMNFNGNIPLLESQLSHLQKENYSIFLQSDTESQSHRMQELLNPVSNDIHFTVGVFHSGFIFEDARLAIFTDHEIFNRYKNRRRQAHFSKAKALDDYESLKSGDYIVHIDYGIGVYQGIKKIKINHGNGAETPTIIDTLAIQYADGDKIYVPTDQLNLVSKFVAQEGVTPEIHRIGGNRWQNTKNRVRKDMEDIAEELVYLYAKRQVVKGYAFSQDTEWQKQLEQSFIYADTPDQITATKEIKRDMESQIPMERLLCGDVGFGKTEVAIRAAFKAVMDSKQVALLAPTTVLAEQHYLIFSERLKDYPVRVEMLSRFVPPKVQKNILDKLRFGEVDILIGTHRLFSGDVQFKDLGLLIIDEEHRFGVRHKEKLKALQPNADVLLLSATPIPRTLNMALSRIKDMTTMNTPPEDRLPIRTAIILYDLKMIESAIRREINRNGQVFYVHNRIETIYTVAERLKKRMPDVLFQVAHAKMPGHELEKIMLNFYHHEFNVLVCTSIIESGLDIPTANTIIVDKAERFGLAQLYQLRGRVGRSSHQAYAYLVMSENTTDTAQKRAKTISQHEALGSGLNIAMRDLEIRGAGNLLGTKQHGVMNTIGLSFYNQILKRAIEKIQTGQQKDIFDVEQRKPKVQCEIPYFFPNNYIPDEIFRLEFYRRLNSAKTESQIDALESEMADRFGTLPSQAQNVFSYYKVNLLAENPKIKSVYIGRGNIKIDMQQDNNIGKKQIKKLTAIKEAQISFSQTSGLRIIAHPNKKFDNYKNNFTLGTKMLKILINQ